MFIIGDRVFAGLDLVELMLTGLTAKMKLIPFCLFIHYYCTRCPMSVLRQSGHDFGFTAEFGKNWFFSLVKIWEIYDKNLIDEE